MEECAKYWMAMDSTSTERYIASEPGLFVIRAPDIGERAEGPRCVHMFTYDKKKIEGFFKKLKDYGYDLNIEGVTCNGCGASQDDSMEWMDFCLM